MELDKRIKEGKRPLTCLDVEQARKFEGKLCLFSSSFVNYKNIREYAKYPQYTGILSVRDKDQFKYIASEESPYRNGNNGYFYELVLPLEWIEEEPEKKYRAFTIKEFQQKYSVGSVLKIREKQNRFTESVVQYVGYKLYEQRIYLGITDFTLNELFENFEMIEPQSDTWHPFGVEE